MTDERIDRQTGRQRDRQTERPFAIALRTEEIRTICVGLWQNSSTQTIIFC